MPTHYLKLFYALLLLLLHSAASILSFNNSAQIKCIEREREALLNFKHSLIDVYGMMSTWRDNENSPDCCNWKGIQCHHQTGLVTILSLPGQYPTSYLSGTVNITSLLALQNIQHLDLSYNDFGGSQIPQLIGSLTNLRYLNLSRSEFGGSIPAQLGNLTHLLSLDLSQFFSPWRYPISTWKPYTFKASRSQSQLLSSRGTPLSTCKSVTVDVSRSWKKFMCWSTPFPGWESSFLAHSWTS